VNKVILSILGRDRPGIVAAVARVLFEQGCNIENVSQTMLQSEFAGIFIVSLPPGLAVETLHAALFKHLSAVGLHVHTKPVRAAGAGQCGQTVRALRHHHPGSGP
jgi:glycine cleavage system transcriptional repressor